MPPLHSKSRQFALSGLFANLTSFEELERRIAAFSENKQKGDAFEVFAEAYLATQRGHDVRQLWPLDAVPLDLLRRLKLPIKDYGVDGVIQNIFGVHQVYQVKFRSHRTPLAWEELSTFMGLSDSPEIQAKIVITNCDKLPEVINERHNFFCVRGSDLDRLTQDNFRAIEAWISGRSLPASKRNIPRDHQQEALDHILPALSNHDRVSVIMACGTGKTLVTLWTAEQVGSRTILVLLPSLALLRQMLHEWKNQATIKFAHLCICSDPSVKGDDAISTSQSDLDFEVSTNPETVRRFLDSPFDGAKVVFSTYQSAKVVGSAMRTNEFFDLGIFDEAHKTAGREGRNYGYALEDRNIRIAKRLFVTATPRHYDPTQRTKRGEAAIAFSMDDPTVYGPQVYTLPLSEAARRGIICNYKVIISVISSDQVDAINDESLSRGTVEVQGDEIRARQVANQIALRDAVIKYGVGKIFTFHSTVKSAASFTSEGSAGVRTHLPAFATHHVSGAMSTAERERILREFRTKERAILSNARCLTEGVDVPAVDMVAFLSPRRSKVDIVQAIGRAMRRLDNKEFGYVLVPLYLEQNAGETLGQAIARANFEEIWEILQSLQEQDNVLAEMIRDMAITKGQRKGFDDSRFSERIDFIGPVLAFESIRNAVATKVLECLESSWDVRYGELISFREENGDCRVPSTTKTHKELADWVTNQKTQYRIGKISAERIARLEEIGFEWDVKSAEWHRMYKSLQGYKKRNGDCRVPQIYSLDLKFGRWVGQQRVAYAKGKLETDKILKLENLGFEWDTSFGNWERMFDALKDYKVENGNSRVPARYKKSKELGKWVSRQRYLYSKNKLSEQKVARLESLAFEWDPFNADREMMIQQLKSYKAAYGDCRVPTRSKAFPELWRWVSRQRSFYSSGQLSEDRIKELESLGFEWDPFIADWETKFEALKAYKDQHGNCRLNTQQDKDLTQWVSYQKNSYSKGKLSAERIARLEALGFEWRLST